MRLDFDSFRGNPQRYSESELWASSSLTHSIRGTRASGGGGARYQNGASEEAIISEGRTQGGGGEGGRTREGERGFDSSDLSNDGFEAAASTITRRSSTRGLESRDAASAAATSGT